MFLATFLLKKEGKEMNQCFENYVEVTLPSRDLRALGREALKGKWKLAIFATFIYHIMTTVPVMLFDYLFPTFDGVSAFSGLYTVLVSGPFLLGYSMFILSVFRNKPANAGQVFSGFEYFGTHHIPLTALSLTSSSTAPISGPFSSIGTGISLKPKYSVMAK